MIRTCPACGEEVTERARFCSACGAPLEEGAAPRELRKTVTVLFCDVTGSTAIGERLDQEPLRRLMLRFYEEIKAVCEAHGGRVPELIGDAVMAAFAVPRVHEDDALPAVRAAAEMRQLAPSPSTRSCSGCSSASASARSPTTSQCSATQSATRSG